MSDILSHYAQNLIFRPKPTIKYTVRGSRYSGFQTSDLRFFRFSLVNKGYLDLFVHNIAKRGSFFELPTGQNPYNRQKQPNPKEERAFVLIGILLI